MIVQLKPLIGKLNDACRSALEGAAVLGSQTVVGVRIEHLLLKLFEQQQSDVHHICRQFQVDVLRVRTEIERTIAKSPKGSTITPSLDPELIRLLQDAWLVGSVNLSAPEVRTGHIILALAETREVPTSLNAVDWRRLEADFDSIVAESRETLPASDGGLQTEPTHRTVKRAVEPRVFLSYRRTDYPLMVDALFNRLLASGCHVFRDTNTLTPGSVFRTAIRDTIASCDSLVAVIGQRWPGVKAGGGNRIDDADDFVRLEIETALEFGKLVIPCVVAGTMPPRAQELPESLRALAERNAVSLSDEQFQQDTALLVETLLRSVTH